MNKILIALIFLTSTTIGDSYILTDEEILAYEIPPSAYLEKLSEIREKRAKIASAGFSAFMYGFGGLFMLGSSSAQSGDGTPGPAFGYFMAAICFGAGTFSLKNFIKDEPLSEHMQRFQDIQNEPDRDKREVLCYNALVWLAKSAPKQNKRSSSAPTSVKGLAALLIVKALTSKKDTDSSEKGYDSSIFGFTTMEKRALDGFLTQTPIDVVF